MSYAPSGQESQLYRVFIPWTDDYKKALELASSKLKRFFPVGTDNEFRWLASKTESKSAWIELDVDVFPAIAKGLKSQAKLRLRENPKLRSVTVLPLGRDEDTFYQFKLVAIGLSSVGKAMMLQNFTTPSADRKDILETKARYHVDISSHLISSDGILLKAELWNTAGQERYRKVSQSVYCNVNGVLLVYNLTKKETLEKCKRWIEDFKNKAADFGQVQVVLVGNQLGLEEQREVSTEEAEVYADQHGFEFAEVSAKEGTNVEQTFQTLMNLIFKKLSAREELQRYQKSRNRQP